MQEILDNLSNTQISFLVLGVFLVLLSFKDAVFGFLGPLFKNDETINKPSVIIKPEIESDTDLTNIVAKWETLSDACKDAGLSEAYQKLQEVFPMLIKIYKSKEVADEEE